MNQELLISELEEKIGYVFKDKNLLLEAVTHSSYTNEMKINKRGHYERLEFLGDAVLELLSSEFLYMKYPNVPEGGLSKKRASMVCEQSLSICARSMELGKFIFFGKGEEHAGGRERDSILADVVEAVLGAIYLDAGLEKAKEYVDTRVLNFLKEQELFVDSKTILQEYVQHMPNGENLHYEIVSEEGPEHDKSFTAQVLLDDKVLGIGKGKTKKAAHQQAAFEAIKKIESSNK